MAIKRISKERIKVILLQDDALDHDDVNLDDKYADYLRDLDESKLPFVENALPIRFVMALTPANIEAASDVLNSQISFDGGKMKHNMGAVLPYLRSVLVDIENPPELPLADRFDFAKDDDGLVSKEIIGAIHAIDGHFYLFSAHVNAKQRHLKISQVTKKN